MPEPWWHWLIAPDALRALAILAAAFAAAWAWRQWKRGPWRIVISGTCCIMRPIGPGLYERAHGIWHINRVSGPWPLHACIGPLSIDVLRRP